MRSHNTSELVFLQRDHSFIRGSISPFISLRPEEKEKGEPGPDCRETGFGSSGDEWLNGRWGGRIRRKHGPGQCFVDKQNPLGVLLIQKLWGEGSVMIMMTGHRYQ